MGAPPWLSARELAGAAPLSPNKAIKQTISQPRDGIPALPRPAGKLLLSAALIALGLSTCLACVWPEGELDDVPVEGLTQNPDYKLWPLWIWIYCIICWFIQVGGRAGGRAGAGRARQAGRRLRGGPEAPCGLGGAAFSTLRRPRP